LRETRRATSLKEGGKAGFLCFLSEGAVTSAHTGD
jgi:hypothetical protein